MFSPSERQATQLPKSSSTRSTREFTEWILFRLRSATFRDLQATKHGAGRDRLPPLLVGLVSLTRSLKGWVNLGSIDRYSIVGFGHSGALFAPLRLHQTSLVLPPRYTNGNKSTNLNIFISQTRSPLALQGQTTEGTTTL